MEEKNFRSNKLTHLFETLLQQDEQERQQEQEQEELEQQEEEEEEEREQAERAAIPFAMMSGGSAGGGGRRKASESTRLPVHGQGQGHGQSEWSAEAVSFLLDSYADKFARGQGFLRNSDWEEVMCTVNARDDSRDPKTVKQCRDKVDSLKKRYKLEKKKAADSGSSLVSWPFFGKLDEMMSCQSRVSRIPGGVDAGVKLPFSESSHPDAFRGGPVQHGFAAEDVPFRKKEKMAIMEDTDALSEDDDSDSSPHQHRQDKHSSRTGSLDEGSYSRKGLGQAGVSEKDSTRKRKAESVDPIQALADAVVGFSDVFARIEMAKMEMYTKMKLEIAKLERKNRKWESSSSSSSSET